jgi:arylsulfatase A-like enzyme
MASDAEGWGFEHFYGFLHGDANHWAPNLVRDNHFIEPPTSPAAGYHLSEDLADQAIRHVLDTQNAAPDKPFFLYWALGATHAPHHVSEEWIEPYRGQFALGWDRLRQQIFDRQLEEGIVPPETVLTERPAWVDPWSELDAETRRMHARQHEVFAGFLSHTDAQIGRFIQFLEEVGQLDHTIVLLMSDNGASAEGGRLGTFNEHRFSARLPESVDGNVAELERWGGFRSYNHYSWAWAWAGNTPLRLWKRYAWLGGTRTPLIVHWPRGFSARGEIRSQFCHAVDILPTVLDACSVDPPRLVDGAPQDPTDGATLVPSFENAAEPDPRSVQYFEMLGSRSIFFEGWKATTDHVSKGVADEEELMEGSRTFENDHWALFCLDEDFSEARDLAEGHPDLVRRLADLWHVEAGRNQVLPLLDDLTSRLGNLMPTPYPPRPRSVFRAGGSPVADESIPLLAGGFTIEVRAEIPEAAEGILCALGDWNGGFALFVRGGHLKFAICPAGVLAVTTSTALLPSGSHRIWVRCEFEDGALLCSLGCDEVGIGTGVHTIPLPFAFQHGGTALTIGYDRGFPVCDDYEPPFPWRGRIHDVTIDVRQPGLHLDQARTALHSD